MASIRFNGPSRSILILGLAFERGQVRHDVADEVAGEILAEQDEYTGANMFERVAEEAPAADPAGVNAGGGKKYRIGAFLKKAEAVEYAKDVHSVDLDETKSMKELNAQTKVLAERALGGASGEDLIAGLVGAKLIEAPAEGGEGSEDEGKEI